MNINLNSKEAKKLGIKSLEEGPCTTTAKPLDINSESAQRLGIKSMEKITPMPSVESNAKSSKRQNQ